jgi:hypothetical protein
MKFSEIKQFIRSGTYEVNVQWKYLLESSYFIDPPKLDLNPDFQREHVWDNNKRIKYLEFILRGGKSSKIIYLNCPGWMNNFKGPFEVVDGKQRLESVIRFLNNEIPIFGNNFLKDFEDKLPLSADLIFNVNNLETREEVLQWYLDLNSGGVVHTEEELSRVKQLLMRERKKRCKL